MRQLISSISGMFMMFLCAFMMFLYPFGIYSIVVDDHRYTTKDVVIGMIVPPYPLWVGGKEVYRFIATTAEAREAEVVCLDICEALDLPRNSRLRFCKCIVEGQDSRICAVKIFGEKFAEKFMDRLPKSKSITPKSLSF
ncbi:MAG: hypothetical protein HOF21_05310 [Nitrospina sp.]|jgi:hypothetical protein|nr:hypothetical protein [Nitrospina sp.]MBT6738820.1 hypothetical protein [Nitrospina sp.]